MGQGSWVNDKRWSDRFLNEIKGILGVHLIGEAPEKEDAEHNTDLIVLRMAPVRIAVRVRRNKYLHVRGYSDECTIRAVRPNGTKTELAKIVEGWGDYFFYGFSDAQERKLERWILGDLSAFRSFYHECVSTERYLWSFPGNRDRSSDFMVFRHRDVNGFVIAEYSGIW